MDCVEVRVKGHVDFAWSEWLEGLIVTHTEEGETLLTGVVRDQSALMGVLNRLPDLGIQLLSVKSRKMDDFAGDNEAPVTGQCG